MKFNFPSIIKRILRSAAVLVCIPNVMLADERPNIVFILTDDQRDNSFSGMGHDWVKTPHTDNLLQRSTRFKNTYIAEPICKPSRSSLFLGCHERVHRVGFSSTHNLNRKQWEQSYPALLKQAGYRNGFVGKWHITTDGFGFDSLFDYSEGHEGHGPFFFSVKDEDGKSKVMTTNEHHTNNALNFLDTVSSEQPFCLSLCLATPHGSKVPKMHKVLDESSSLNPKLKDHPIYGGMYRDLEIAYPLENPVDPYLHIPKHVMDQDAGRNTTYKFDYDAASNKEHIIRYFQMITEIDQMIGRIIQGLEDRGLSKNTIVIFASDHGLLLGEYGMGGKGLLYDLASKIPCYIYDPAAELSAKGQVRDELVSSLDITATILDYAGVDTNRYMEGVSLKELVQSSSKVSNWRRGLFLESLYTGRDTPLQEGFVTDRWKYIRCFKADHPYADIQLEDESKTPVFEMLFDLSNDPKELKNLIEKSEVQDVLESMRTKCVSGVSSLNKKRLDYFKSYVEE